MHARTTHARTHARTTHTHTHTPLHPQAIFSMMLRDPDPGNRPDSYTYAAIVRCILTSRRYELLLAVYNQMVTERVALAPEVWTQLVTAAARSKQLGLAQKVCGSCGRAWWFVMVCVCVCVWLCLVVCVVVCVCVFVSQCVCV